MASYRTTRLYLSCEFQVCFVRTWGSSGSEDGQFISPSDVAIDSTGYVYVTYEGNNRVQKFTSDSKFITTWGSSGTGEGQLNSTAGIDVVRSTNVYVSEWINDRIHIFANACLV